METIFSPKQKIYICHYRHPNGKTYAQKRIYTMSLPKVERYFNNNPEQYEKFKNKLLLLRTVQEKAYYLQSITNLSLSCCRKYVVNNNL